jgi:hypothetical protein
MEKYSKISSRIIELNEVRKQIYIEFQKNINQLSIEFPNKHKSKKSNAYKEYAMKYKEKEQSLIHNFYKKVKDIDNEIRKILTGI